MLLMLSVWRFPLFQRLGDTMKIESKVRLMAGIMILFSLLLYITISDWWLLLTLFVGVNLVQSAFTGCCPAESLLEKLPCGCCNKNSDADNSRKI